MTPPLYRSLLLLLSSLLIGCGGPKFTPEQTADQFFAQLQQGKFADAYAATTFAFQAQQAASMFESKARELHLNESTGVTWQRTAEASDEVRLSGTFKRSEGQTPVRLTLHLQGRRWLVADLTVDQLNDIGQSVVFTSFGSNYQLRTEVEQQVPPLPAQEALVRETASQFADALARQDFQGLYDYVSRVWQKQSSYARFAATFQSFVDRKIELLDVDTAKIHFSEPARIASDSTLSLTGTVQVKPKPLNFIFKYHYEELKWRLFGVKISVDDDVTSTPRASASPATP